MQPPGGAGRGQTRAGRIWLRHVQRAVHLRHSGPTPKAREEAGGVFWIRGRHFVRFLLRRERRDFRGAIYRARRDHLRRAQPRVTDRRHSPLQGRAPALSERRHVGARKNSQRYPSCSAAGGGYPRRLLHGWVRRATSMNNANKFRDRVSSAGLQIKAGSHPIVPIMIGDARMATEIARDLLEDGIYVIGFSYPVVPKGQARIRVQFSAAHNEEHIERAVNAFSAVARRRGVLRAT